MGHEFKRAEGLYFLMGIFCHSSYAQFSFLICTDFVCHLCFCWGLFPWIALGGLAECIYLFACKLTEYCNEKKLAVSLEVADIRVSDAQRGLQGPTLSFLVLHINVFAMSLPCDQRRTPPSAHISSPPHRTLSSQRPEWLGIKTFPLHCLTGRNDYPTTMPLKGQN